MRLYTVIMDYAGGTYISQVNALSPKAACLKWAKNLNVSQVNGLGERGKQLLIEQIKEENPLSLTGLLNAWCTTAHVRGKLALINVIQTANEKKPA